MILIETHSVGADQEGGVGSLVLVVAGVMNDALPGKSERLAGNKQCKLLCRFTASRGLFSRPEVAFYSPLYHSNCSVLCITQ